MSLLPWTDGVVAAIDEVNEEIRRFFVQRADGMAFRFVPGQFITLDLPIHPKINRRLRSYSIASPPDGSNTIELIIKYVPGGAASRYLWESVTTGTALRFRGPQGTFVLPDRLDTDICMVATTTGVAPFRSMLLDLRNHPKPRKKIFLIFGTRYLSGVLYRQEFEALQQILPEFYYSFILSRETDANYTGPRGYVHALYEQYFADQRPAHFYLCGWRNMIDEARQRLSAMGYKPQQIHVELYG